MKPYWDTSALVEATIDPVLRSRVRSEQPYTRTHSLAEAFSALTGGNLGIRLEADDATATLENLAEDLDFVELDKTDVLTALKTARRKGVRGGRVHDYLHAVAAEKQKATQLVTLDRNDFVELTTLTIEQLP
ncbi:MAG: PIN domain-containing protein [Verrucomicrobia subdivision 3 bacterium]|nr:PIN domain-containing protein [Limisphaerales bacterium]